MANLLPPAEQKRVWAMYRARFLIAASLVLLLFAVLAALTTIPSYLALELASPPAPVDPSGHRNSPEDLVGIGRAQTTVRVLKPFTVQSTSTSAIVKEALAVRPAGVSVTHVALTTGVGSQMTVSGTASRDAVSAYRDALSKDPYFASVSVPVNALVGSDNGQFSITLSGNF